MNIMNQITLKGLKKNKTRTIVTIIGIILSAAMITAVTTFASSIQSYIVNYTISKTGDWHLKFDIENIEDYHDIKEDNRVEHISLVHEGGYSLLEGGTNQYKPYLYIMELDSQGLDTLPIYLTQGRLPENSQEIVIPEHISTNGGVEFKIGDQLELEVGQRYVGDFVLNQNNPITYEEDEKTEELRIIGSRAFTVVGICQRFSYELEDYSAPGYSVITKMDESVTANEHDSLSVYLKLNKPRKVYELAKDLHEKYGANNFTYNSEVLRYQGISNIGGFNRVIYSLATIVMILIMVGSISLIYNSFSISVSERKKQFGLLSSVGATRKQLINSVFYEALVIGLIGIPLGIGSGILGIGVTLYLLKDNFVRMIGERLPVELTLSVSLPSVIAAIIVSIITILISAYIPARRAKKISAMDAVRQTADIKLTARTVKTSVLTRKLFGIEGDIALKNLKRNKRRYRSTVFSLFISVLLFISASSFSMYLTDSVENVYEDYNFELAYFVYESDNLSQEHKQAFEDICKLDGIDDGATIRAGYWETILSKEQIIPSYYTKMLDYGYLSEDGESLTVNVFVYSVDHTGFLNYINKLGLDKEKYQNPEELTAIAIDRQHYFNADEERYINTSIFKEHSETKITVSDNDESPNRASLVIGAFTELPPLGLKEYSYGNSIVLIVDEEVVNDTQSKIKDMVWDNQYQMFFKSNNPDEAVEDIKKILVDAGLDTGAIFNIAERVEDNRNIITILNVFAYGFIVLMSLITIANVFNTISTNINLRRREFAMLKSVGITNSGFNKMLNYECIFYGLKALFYGLPASIVVTYLIYLGVMEGVDMNFYLPIKSILISVLSVFLVVFISMMYSMRKIRNENILDALKNENL